jgi:branched-subunit amino acid transport protein
VSVWAVVLAAGAVTFGLRVLPLVLLRSGEPPTWIGRSAGYVLPAAFSALAASSLAATASQGVSAVAPVLAAVAVAAIAARRVGSSTTALLYAMPTLWLVAAIVP